jgi:hypothetical protein
MTFVYYRSFILLIDSDSPECIYINKYITWSNIMFIVKFFKRLIREYRFKKRLKELREKDPFIYK